MKNTLRALFSVSVLALLLVATPVLAAEVDVTAQNTTTGALSNNDNTYDVDHDVNVDIDNDANIDNDADVDADSGDNVQDYNTNAGDLETGSLDVTGEWENAVNQGTGLCDCPISDSGVVVEGDFSNDTTGYDSDNTNDLDVDVDVDVDINNDADIDNNLDVDLDSGDNSQSYNTNAGNLATGDATLEFMIANWANNSSGSNDSDAAGVAVNVSGSNETTGALSNNDNSFDVDADYNVDVNNDADVDNDVDVDVDTGGNSQDYNTNAGDLESGDADVVLGIENSVNNSNCCPTLGSTVDVTADFSNDTTGYDSDNTNSLDVDSDVDVDINNDADVDNNIDVDADTGDNSQSYNTNAGSTKTGDVTIQLNLSNSANSSN